MKIGIIVYSGTGTTLRVAKKLRQKLASAGHQASVETIAVTGTLRPGAADISVTNAPDPAMFEAVVFAAPVMAFSLSPAMAAYFKGVKTLKGKKTALLVTQGFPFAAWGGNQALAQMRAACSLRGADVAGTGVVNRMNFNMKGQIEKVTSRLAGLF